MDTKIKPVVHGPKTLSETIARAFMGARNESHRKGQKHSTRRYNGISARVFGFDAGKGVIGDTMLHGIYAELYRQGLIFLVRFGKIFSPGKEARKFDVSQPHEVAAFIKGIDTYAKMVGATVLPWDPKKAVDEDGFVPFFYGSVEDFAAWMLTNTGMIVNDGFWAYAAKSQEKMYKQLSCKIEDGTTVGTWYWNLQLSGNMDKITAAIRKISGHDHIMFEESLIDGCAWMSDKHPFATHNDLKAGWVGQCRGNASMDVNHAPVPNNQFKGVVYCLKERDYNAMNKLFDYSPADPTKVIVGSTNTLKNTLEGKGYWIPNMGIHARWDANLISKRHCVVGFQGLGRNAGRLLADAPIYDIPRKKTRDLVEALSQAWDTNDTTLLSEYCGNMSLHDLEDHEQLIDSYSAIRLGRPWSEISRAKSADHLVGKLIADSGKATVDCQRDYAVSPLLWWVIVGKEQKLKDGSCVLSPQARKQMKDCGALVNVFRNPIISEMGAMIPMHKVCNPKFYIRGSIFWLGRDLQSKLVGGNMADDDLDGDMFAIIDWKWLPIDPEAFWSASKVKLTYIRAWDDDGGDVNQLGFITRPVSNFGGDMRSRGLWLSCQAQLGIPAMDSRMGLTFMRGGSDTWQLKAAYQTIVKLIKHEGEGDIVDIKAMAVDIRERAADYRVYMALKKGDAVTETLGKIADILNDLEDGKVESGRTVPAFQAEYISTWWQFFMEHMEMPKWNGVVFPEYTEARQVNPLMAFIMGNSNLRRWTHRPDWTLAMEDEIYRPLHYAAARELANKNNKAMEHDNGPAQMSLSEAKKLTEERIELLIAWHMKMRLAIRHPEVMLNNPMDVTRIDPHLLLQDLGLFMGFNWEANQSLNRFKVYAYQAEIVQWLSLSHAQFVAMVCGTLWWSFAESAKMESNLWYLGAKTVAIFLSISGKGAEPEVGNRGQDDDVYIDGSDYAGYLGD